MAKDFYRTEYGRAVLTRAKDYLPCLPDASVDLIMTSPPFALLRQKAYGNLDQAEYIDWLVSFGPQIRRVLKDTGSFVLDLGGAYQRAFAKDNGGALPSNLLQYPNTESNSLHIRLCKARGIEPHPARFPKALPEFFIKLLTQPGDLVLDLFAGSNTTGEAAESLGRRWLALSAIATT